MNRVILCLLVWTTVAYGQTPTASLSGVVMDPSGGLVPGAEVKVKNNATAAEFEAITNEMGSFTVPAPSAGTYTVTVTLPGFKQAVLPDVKDRRRSSCFGPHHARSW